MADSEAPGALEFLVPGDPEQNTGGYRYVRKLVETLNEQGHKARVTGLPGQFPRPDDEARSALDQQLANMPDGTCVVLDGLAMGGLPEVVEKHHKRLTLLALVHHPLADETGLGEAEMEWFYAAEKRALAFVTGIITTSRHTAARLLDYGVPAEAARVAEPGVTGPSFVEPTVVESPEQPPPERSVPHLLCVAHLSQRKAQHQLVEALRSLKALPWQCTLAGSDSREPEYGESVRRLIEEAGLGQRVRMTGVLGERDLLRLYREADVFVFPSLYEGYGMVIDEALAAGLPIISSDGGALADTAARPGVVQFRAGDVPALTGRIRHWLEHPQEREHARKQAAEESQRVRTWPDTAADFLEALKHFTGTHQHSRFASSWLSVREEADHRARSRELTETLNGWLSQQYSARKTRHQPLRMVDLGTGRGSNAVFLAPSLQVPQAWLALDQDAALLNEAKQRMATLNRAFETAAVQLTTETLAQYLPRDTSLITASALIDLVSEPWLCALARAAVARESAVLIVLSYAGHFELSPEHPDDSWLRDLVNCHQHGDKGTGAALGPEASERLQKLLAEQGHTVALADSPWQLDADDSPLIRMLMAGWVEAAIEQAPDARDRLIAWLERRSAQLETGGLKVSVKHTDLLALPPGEGHWRD